MKKIIVILRIVNILKNIYGLLEFMAKRKTIQNIKILIILSIIIPL